MAINFKAIARAKKFQKLKDDLKKLGKNAFDRSDAFAIGHKVTSMMLDNMNAGISPITGKRFPNYKKPQKYPGKKKPSTPVNLELTGDFKNALSVETTEGQSGQNAVIFYEGKEDLKEQGHRDGAKGQPKRPTIPQGNENFSPRIVTQIVGLARKIISKKLSDL